MTIDEAINELELIAKVTMWNDRREAVEMAIEALQAEPVVRCIDCIFWYDCEYTFKSENGFCCCGAREEE